MLENRITIGEETEDDDEEAKKRRRDTHFFSRQRKDTYSGQDLNHRRQWLFDKIKLEAGLSAIDICAYATMSNHYHLVLRVDRERALGWSDDEVIERWCGQRLCNSTQEKQIKDRI